MDMKETMMEMEQKRQQTHQQIGQVEQKTHSDKITPQENINSEKAQQEKPQIEEEEKEEEENQENNCLLASSRPVIALKRIIKQQHVWGFNGALIACRPTCTSARACIRKFSMFTIVVYLLF